MTEEKFIITSDGRRIYRTGDIGRVNVAGRLECYGRVDSQVKINGYRVELEEIDVCIEQSSDSIEGVITCYDKNEAGGELIAFYKSKEIIDRSFFITQLRTVLPQYMIPSKYLNVENLMYTHSNKADRNGMLVIYIGNISNEKDLEQRQDTEKDVSLENSEIENITVGQDTIMSVIERVLMDTLKISAEEITSCEDLRDVGMDSLNFINTIVAIEESFSIEFEDNMLTMGRLRTIYAFKDYVLQLIK